ncbi:unnamed protein product [Sphacelaria rigidula]
MGQQQAAREAGVSEATASVEATVRLVSPGRSEIIPKVSIQTGGTVRWVHGGGASTIAGAKEAVAGGAAVDQGEKVELVSTRKKDDGVGRCICGGEGNRVKEEGMTVLIISDVLDEPMTRQIPLGGSYADLMFDRPGSYAYYVYSGPVTKGHVVVEETHTADAATAQTSPRPLLSVRERQLTSCPNIQALWRRWQSRISYQRWRLLLRQKIESHRFRFRCLHRCQRRRLHRQFKKGQHRQKVRRCSSGGSERRT